MGEMVCDYVGEDCYKVTLTRDGISAHCYVSSMHLVEDKRKQLNDEINRTAVLSYVT